MFLVKAGKSAEPLLNEALAHRENVPIVLSVLADIGPPGVDEQLLASLREHRRIRA